MLGAPLLWFALLQERPEPWGAAQRLHDRVVAAAGLSITAMQLAADPPPVVAEAALTGAATTAASWGGGKRPQAAEGGKPLLGAKKGQGAAATLL